MGVTGMIQGVTGLSQVVKGVLQGCDRGCIGGVKLLLLRHYRCILGLL